MREEIAEQRDTQLKLRRRRGKDISVSRALVLIMLFTAISTSTSSLGQTGECEQISKFWVPPLDSSDTVAKWDNPVDYTILFDDKINHNQQTDDFSKLVVKELDEFGNISGTKINYILKGNVQLIVFISNNVASYKFLNGKFLTYYFGKDSPGVALPDFRAVFSQRATLIARGCSSIFIRINGIKEIRGAVLLLQSDKDQLCVDEAIAGALGEKYIFDNDSSTWFNRDKIIAATKQLYDRRVTSGETGTEAEKTIDGLCK